ncbi:cytidine deaminase [Halanaerocella petrolearia]
MREELIEAARKVRKNAYVPYSEFKVGAALLTAEGDIYTGCNVENSSYGLANCAERTAIFKAVSEGKQDFKALAVVTDTDQPATPCGACRQVISEFGPDIEVIMANLDGDVITRDINELLWGAFSLTE